MAEMSNAVNMSFRVDKNLKKEADMLFKKLGLNTSVALNMFLSQSVREQAIPFNPTMEIFTPSNRLLKALEEAEAIEKGLVKAKRYNTFQEALEDLDNEV